MNKLSGAYEEALNKLRHSVGPAVTQIVQTVIEAKQNLAEFEQLTSNLEVQEELIAILVDQVSDNVATMCNIVGKSFKAEIMPLVEKVTKEAKQSKQLQ